MSSGVVCRIWHGWTTAEGAAAYEGVLRGEVIPAIEAREIDGFLGIDVLRRPVPEGVEFATVMWFRDLDAVRAFVGDDHEVAHVPDAARAVLARFDERSAHFEVLERRTPG